MDPQTLLPDNYKEHSEIDKGMWLIGLFLHSTRGAQVPG